MAPRPRKPHAIQRTARAKRTEREPGLRYRLPLHTRPTRYQLHVRVAPERSKRYEGDLAIDIRLTQATSSIVLHACELRVASATIEVAGVLLAAKIVPHPLRETVELITKSVVPIGSATVRLRFFGKLRADLRGLYAARSGDRRYAFTQLEAADARRFFPCFDEPSFKAVFCLRVTTSPGNTVISNAAIEAVEPTGHGDVTVRFWPTALLSTYLVALAVGPLEASPPVMCGETEIRVHCVPGNVHLTAFALEAARETLVRLEAYFDVPYPYGKLDLVAVPDFEIGAMENAGAVFFRETLLLIDESTVTLTEQKRAVEVICHELAHMWYGNLVTMAWWDDLWLNEAFATWMAFHIVDQWRPEWRMWNDFGHARSSALALDALRNTHPIYATVRTPEDATENFDLITYEKGAAVVRMIERYLGPTTFRAGVRRYVRRHRESNTVAADLWRALSEVSRADVEQVVRPWIEQAGFPLLRLRRITRDGHSTLQWSQERFFADAAITRRRKGKSPSIATRWPLPFVARAVPAAGRRTRVQRALLTGGRGDLLLQGEPPRFVYGNADEGGFFRPLHDAAELQAIAAAPSKLSATERLGLVGHQWALVQAGYAPIDSLLSLAEALRHERDADVLAAVGTALDDVVEHLADAAGPDIRARLQRWLIGVFSPDLRLIGLDADGADPTPVRLRRAELFYLVGDLGEWTPLLSHADDLCRRLLDDRSSVDPNLADAIVRMGARQGDEDRYQRYLAASIRGSTPQERRRFRMGLADFREPDLLVRTGRLCLSDDIPTQDVALVLARLLGNREGRDASWEFIKRHWPKLRKRMPTMLLGRLVEATPALGTPKHARDVSAFFRKYPIPTAARALRQALERFRLLTELRQRTAPSLQSFVERSAPSNKTRSLVKGRTRG